MILRRCGIALLVVGLMLLNYPPVMTVWNNLHTVGATVRSLAQNSDSDIDEAIAQAEAYNSRMDARPVLDPWLDKVENSGSPEWNEYEATLNLDGNTTHALMGKVVVPSAGIDLPVWHGTSDEVLAKGAGHIFGTSLPVGGDSAYSIITGHSGLLSASMFDRLRDVRVGDAVYMNYGTHTRAWRVEKISTITPEDVSGLAAQPGQDILALITCTPYGVNSHRLVVEAVRDTTLEASVARHAADLHVQWREQIPWWAWCVFAVDLLVIAGVVWRLVAKRSDRRRGSNEEKE
ncbi:class C sortase [Arcanobacterium haemolyticum]|nr:class C sortase [Arcanobacterium haemolyticum]